MKALILVAFVTLATQFTLTAEAAWMKDILVCDGGAATVSIDLGERRHVRLVVNNRAIAEYFANRSQGRGPLDIRDGKIEIGDRLNDGIFDSSQFRGFETKLENYPAVQVYRSGSGLVLRLVS